MPSASAPLKGRMIPGEAELPDGEPDAYLTNGPLAALNPHTPTDPESIRREIDGVSQSGVSFNRREIGNDRYSMTGAGWGSDGTAPGTVSQSLLHRVPDAAEQRRMIRRLRALAAGGGMATR